MASATVNITKKYVPRRLSYNILVYIYILEVWGPSGPQLLAGGPSGGPSVTHAGSPVALFVPEIWPEIQK